MRPDSAPTALRAPADHGGGLDLTPVLHGVINATVKGFPPAADSMRLSDVGTQGWNLLRGDLPFPVAVLKDSALRHNSGWMRRFLAQFGAAIAPHGKTTMAPQLFERQLADGAWGITVATVQQLMVCRRFGVRRVILANQLVGAAEIEAVLDEIGDVEEFEFFCLVDSVEGVDRLAGSARQRRLNRPVHLLLEGGFAGGRTGCRDLDSALAVARAAAAQRPFLALRGVEGFEGLIRGDTPAHTASRVEAFIKFLADIAMACAREDMFAPGPIILSAGGSAFYDLAVRGLKDSGLGREAQLILRSGCYLTHDSQLYETLFEELCRRTPEARALGPGLRHALEVWTCIQSVPERGLAIATAGKRDLSYDLGLPVPVLWFRPGQHERPQPLPQGCTVSGLNDQHAFVQLPDGLQLAVGDMLAFGISHPCTTFDKWQLLYLVDDDYGVLEGIRTYF